MQDCNLTDILLTGYKFTCFRSRGMPNMVEERLDRPMGNTGWHQKFSRAVLHNLIVPVSNHNPILLDTKPIMQYF